MNLPASRAYGGVLAIVRILTGAIWIIHALPKFLDPDAFMPPSGFFAVYLQRGLAKTAGPYHDFLTNVVAPNAVVFADLVRFGELCVGVSLFLGVMTRLGGFFGIVLALDYMAARGALGTLSGWGSIDACLALLSVISLLLPTGRIAGFDGIAMRRPMRRHTLVAEVVPERPLSGPTAPQ